MTTQSVTKSTSRKSGTDWSAYASQFGALGVLIIICIIFAIIEPAFISPINLFNVLRQVSIYGLLALGMTFVILTGGFVL